jgi:isoamylase
LIRFRGNTPILRRGTFASSDEDSGQPWVEWHGVALHQPDWSHDSRSLAMHLHGCPDGAHEHIYLISNAHWEAHEFELPVVPGWRWVRVVDTSLESPDDIAEPGQEPVILNSQSYAAGPRSTVVLMGLECGAALQSRAGPPGQCHLVFNELPYPEHSVLFMFRHVQQRHECRA